MERDEEICLDYEGEGFFLNDLVEFLLINGFLIIRFKDGDCRGFGYIENFCYR